MLRKSSLNIAHSYAADLVANNAIIMPMPNTVLNNLVGNSIPLNLTNIANTEEETLNLIEIYSTGTLDKPSEHDRESDSLIKDLSTLVTKHLSYAKNTVKPLVLQLTEAIENYINSNNSIDPSTKFNIEIVDIPSILNNDSFLNTINYAKGRNPLIPSSNGLSDEAKNNDEIIAFMLSGSETINKLIVEWVTNKDQRFLTDIWNSFFSTNSAVTYFYSNIGSMDPYLQADIYLAIYLIANGLQKNIQNVKTSLTNYKNNVQDIIDYSVRSLASIIDKINAYNKTKILVLSTDKKNNTVRVNKSVYTKWVSEGNDPVILLGMLVSGPTISSVDLLENKKDGFKQMWATYCNMYSLNETEKLLSYYKEFLTITFADMLKNISEEEQNFITKCPEYFSVVIKLSKEVIDKLSKNDISDPSKVALILIAKCRFYYTSSFNILNDINNAASNNKEIDVREAALVATINYMSDYLSDQISITK